MKKITLLSLALTFIFLSSNISFSQRYTAPSTSIGLGLSGNFATNDFYGTSLTNSGNYGAIWGRGINLTAKFGLGQKKSSRIVVGAEYNKMVNSYDKNKTPLLMNPVAPHTFYDIIGGAVGYEYVFRPNCDDRQYLGLLFTTNMISAPVYNSNYGEIESSTRFGLALTGGFEWIFGAQKKWGLNLGMKYNFMNMFNASNSNTPGNINLNDGDGLGGPGFKRALGMFSMSVGLNYYLGQMLKSGK
ncbi:MAG TPA: hypothetical protein PLG90_05255 [Ignavibacteria bacterium]|nr:hypothetical protein [Ignavibacteria bacterium]